MILQIDYQIEYLIPLSKKYFLMFVALTRERDHELFELVFILAKLHHEQTTESCVEDRPTSHVTQHWSTLSVRIHHAQEREVLALKRFE